jgi:hypothetical protein
MIIGDVPDNTLNITLPVNPPEINPKPKKSIRKVIFAIIFAFLSIVILLGAGVFLLSRNYLSLQNPVNIRTTGQTKINAEGEVNTPIYEDSTIGKNIDTKGGVISSKLKNGIPVYLIVPAKSLEKQRVEISEFKEMPTSPTHVPLYNDFGYGLNITYEKVSFSLDTPSYLVFDFSKGKKLEEYKSMTKHPNVCDFSDISFNPSTCATMLSIPTDKTLNNKYFAVTPKYADDGRRPTFPVYSYYLGNDDILVLRITTSTIIIPEPLNQDVVKDVVTSTFGRYVAHYEEFEAFDLMNHFNLEINNKDVIGEILSKYYPEDIKTFNASEYTNNLYSKAVENKLIDPSVQLSPEVLNKELLGETKPIENVIKTSYNSNSMHNLLSGISNIRRIYDSRIEGSAKAALKYLKELHKNIKDNVYSAEEKSIAFQAEGILLGKLRFSSKILGESSDVETSARSEFETEVARIFPEWQKNLSEAINMDLHNASATSGNLTEWLKLIEALGGEEDYAKTLTESVKKSVEDLLITANTNPEIIKAAEACNTVLADSRCNDINKKVNSIKQ